jgi:hypothetical protein
MHRVNELDGDGIVVPGRLNPLRDAAKVWISTLGKSIDVGKTD